MFRWGVLRQRSFDIPVVVVGNIGVGGTGKTPHTEYIVDLLRYKYHIGVLSRGYRRSTKGFVLASRQATPRTIGDEPYQMYRKFAPDVTVAVCENRCDGIDEMLRLDPKINLIILDDAFQHRYVKPAVSVVLTEFKNPVFKDHLMPLGRLREPFSAIYRADMVVVTKCPPRLRGLDYRLFKDNLKLFPYQQLFFSTYDYGPLRPVFPDHAPQAPNLAWLTEADSILVVAGIANPKPLMRYLRSFPAKVRLMAYDDHHHFSRADYADIARRFNSLKGNNKLIITTEKDAVRMARSRSFPDALKSFIYFQPITVKFDPRNETSFADQLQKAIEAHRPQKN